MKASKIGWVVSATLRKSALAIERSGPGAGISMIQAQNVVIAPTFMEAIKEFMGSVGPDMTIVAINLNMLPVVEVESEPDPDKK